MGQWEYGTNIKIRARRGPRDDRSYWILFTCTVFTQVLALSFQPPLQPPSNYPSNLIHTHCLPYSLLKPSWLVRKQPKRSWFITQPNYPTFIIDRLLLFTHIFGEKFYARDVYKQFRSNLRPTTKHAVENKDLFVCFIQVQSKTGFQWGPELLPSYTKTGVSGQVSPEFHYQSVALWLQTPSTYIIPTPVPSPTRTTCSSQKQLPQATTWPNDD